MSLNVTEAPRRRITLGEVRARREEIRALAERWRVGNVRVFGSVARGDSDESSDLDLLIDYGPKTDLLDLAGFALDVEETLGVYTQVATVQGLKPRIRDRVLREAVPL